jgi:acyl carrier protein
LQLNNQIHYRPGSSADLVTTVRSLASLFNSDPKTDLMSLFQRLQEVMATTLKVPPAKITETTINEDLVAWDSLGHVNLMVALEQTFDIFLDVEDFPLLISVPAILQYLRDHGKD